MIYKMLVMNIDDTLITTNGRIHKLTREAVEFALRKDVIITLATSRNFPAAKRLAKTLKIDSHIVAHQGGFIANALNKPIYVKRISDQITNELVSLLESFSCQMKLVHEKKSIGNKIKQSENMIARVEFQSANRFSYSEQYVDSVSESLLDRPISPPKIEVVFEQKSDLDVAKSTIKQMYDEVDCIVADERKLDIVGSGVSKLAGVQYVCDQLHINREEVVAIGSGVDDLPLIEWAGVGVAMGNAPEEIRLAADWITRSNDDQGVSYMIKEQFRKQYRIEFLRRNNMLK
ncbi:Cof-type HAD-IIB family hydrolase [Bacillus sp. FJAT-50079]|uniref:Cof-type HAD-IIB family hydrolase n=1 Tax=Bacillus sp. FJAT-50079 TaxID=2833577 RepID=UPI001BC8DA9F|nr:Cof-type HAD-IIB family hydrolase [Bacillus sp. FJAT-50079]MBS4210709.1 HAD family phosphatase [Bacillus sp. FJAT-50079]